MEAIFDISIKKLQDPNLKFHENTLHIPFCKSNVPWVHIFNSSESTWRDFAFPYTRVESRPKEEDWEHWVDKLNH